MRRLLGGRAPHHVSCFSFPLCCHRPRTNRRILANTRPWMLHVASACTPCCLLLHVIACCWSCYAKFETGQTFEPATPNISFLSWSPTHGLQTLMGCILPTMHCRSQYCWELLHPLAHHCQHGRNNSQHHWPNNVGSCCVNLHVALCSKTIRTAKET